MRAGKHKHHIGLVQQYVVAKPIDKDIPYLVAATAGQVAECLSIYPPAEGLMEEVYNIEDGMTYG